MRTSARFIEAVSAWRKQPSRARLDALHYFRDEAAQSDDWARHEDEMGRGAGEECRRHREDASAMRAALAVLMTVAEWPKVTRKDCQRLLRQVAVTKRSVDAQAARLEKLRAGLKASRSVPK